MSRATLLSAAFITVALSLTSTSAQTNANEGGRLKLAEALYAKAESFFKEGRYGEAAGSYREAALLAPEWAKAHSGLCVSRFKLGEYEGALEACRRAAESQPDSPQVRVNLGRVLKELGRAAEAAEELRRAAALKPDWAAAHAGLGEAYSD